MTTFRKIVQLAAVAGSVYLGLGMLQGWGASTVETYCPFGGLATSYSFLTQGRLSCATGELNLALAGALLLSALVIRKGFCSWICPVGAVHEWLSVLGRRIRLLFSKKGLKTRRGIVQPPERVHSALRWLRLPVLAVVLVASWMTAELVFRSTCPYYVGFSMYGHEVQLWSYALLAVLLVGAVVVPMLWCRYLCPLGGALWPLASFGALRIARNTDACSACKLCDAACPQAIKVSSVDQVKSGDCTLCLECTTVCKKHQALELRWAGRPARRARPIVVPAVIAAFAALGVIVGSVIAIPSFTQSYGDVAAAEQRSTATFVVSGIKCVSTAEAASKQLEGLKGVLELTAYASKHEAEVVYDAAVIDVEAIRRAFDAPVYNEQTGEFFFHVYTVTHIDGAAVE